MKQSPIIFSKPMVLAILAGHKTQTRRLVKLAGKDLPHDATGEEIAQLVESPYAHPGDRLWVKEAWCTPQAFDHLRPSVLPMDTPIEYRADGESRNGGKWRTPLFMPRWASRITLEIAAVRMERLQEISEADARAEGMGSENPVEAYRTLWESLHGMDAWAKNPWVWLLEFAVR
ncbi:MAG TPA: hypothetical protein VFX01_05170 [Methylophilaceae bacterium]|nr:hypothetical protein [Methylophilaceae bacterium]